MTKEELRKVHRALHIGRTALQEIDGIDAMEVGEHHRELINVWKEMKKTVNEALNLIEKELGNASD